MSLYFSRVYYYLGVAARRVSIYLMRSNHDDDDDDHRREQLANKEAEIKITGRLLSRTASQSESRTSPCPAPAPTQQGQLIISGPILIQSH